MIEMEISYLLMFLLPIMVISVRSKRMEYTIKTQWDGTSIDHDPIRIKLSYTAGDDFIKAMFSGPFFNDPIAPNGPVGKPFPQLWDYEVAEIFFLADKSEDYLEVEVSPHGQHLLLLLRGRRNMVKDELSMNYTSSINNTTKTWSGNAEIPLSYLPKGVNKMNAYAIHGSDNERTYEALYPADSGKFTQPDFHRLEYFENFKIDDIAVLQETDKKKIGKYWDTI